MDNTVDPATGTIRIGGVVPNEEAKVFPGFFVFVRLPGEHSRDAVLVEETALGTDLGGRYVMIVGDDDVVERRTSSPVPSGGRNRVVLDGPRGRRTLHRQGASARPAGHAGDPKRSRGAGTCSADSSSTGRSSPRSSRS